MGSMTYAQGDKETKIYVENLKRVLNEKYDYETPLHKIFLPEYSIGRYPVTNKEYRKFSSHLTLS